MSPVCPSRSLHGNAKRAYINIEYPANVFLQLYILFKMDCCIHHARSDNDQEEVYHMFGPVCTKLKEYNQKEWLAWYTKYAIVQGYNMDLMPGFPKANIGDDDIIYLCFNHEKQFVAAAKRKGVVFNSLKAKCLSIKRQIYR